MHFQIRIFFIFYTKEPVDGSVGGQAVENAEFALVLHEFAKFR